MYDAQGKRQKKKYRYLDCRFCNALTSHFYYRKTKQESITNGFLIVNKSSVMDSCLKLEFQTNYKIKHVGYVSFVNKTNELISCFY